MATSRGQGEDLRFGFGFRDLHRVLDLKEMHVVRIAADVAGASVGRAVKGGLERVRCLSIRCVNRVCQ